MRTNIKIVETIEDIKLGKLLTKADLKSRWYSHKYEAVSIDNDQKLSFNLDPAILKKIYFLGTIRSAMSWHLEFTPKKIETSLLIIKGMASKDMIIKWHLADMYAAKSRDRSEMFHYQDSILAAKKSMDLYLILIDELLQHFEEDCRRDIEIILKVELYCRVASSHADSYRFIDALSVDIKNALQSINEPSTLFIERIQEVCAAMAALEVGMLEYRRAYDDLVYRDEAAMYKTGDSIPINPKEEYSGELGFLYYSHKNIKAMGVSTPSLQIYEDFIRALAARKQPQVTLNVVQSNNTDSPLKTEISSPIMWSMKAVYYARSYLMQYATSRYHAEPLEERRALLDNLNGYSPMYCPPKGAMWNSVDRDIKMREKNLMENIEIALSPEDIMNMIKGGINLMSLIHMRYRTNLNDTTKLYITLFLTETRHNQHRYFELLLCYMEHFICKPLNNLPDMSNKEIIAIADSLESYVHTEHKFDCVHQQRCINILDNLKQSLHINDVAEITQPVAETNVRRRVVALQLI